MGLLQKLIAFYRIINLLSIDVALGAVCSAMFFAHILEVTILTYGLISLGLSVWIIYTADHLMDARKIKTPAATTRHQFHQNHFKALVIFTGVALLVNAVIIFFIRKPVLISGVVVAALVGVYLLAHRYLNFMKEFFIALFYTIGILLPSISVTPLVWKEWPGVVIVQFFVTALINLILFSWFDYQKDLRDGNNSFATVLGERTGRVFIIALFIVIAILAFTDFSRGSFVVILIMNLILLIVFVFHKYFAIEDRFRMAGDFIFFIPLLYLLR